MTIFDSSGIEAFVTENNPKYANRIIKQLKAYAKAQRSEEHTSELQSRDSISYAVFCLKAMLSHGLIYNMVLREFCGDISVSYTHLHRIYQSPELSRMP